MAGGIPEYDPYCSTCQQSQTALDSVEILRVGESEWEYTTALPVPLLLSSGITVDNVVLLMGGGLTSPHLAN